MSDEDRENYVLDELQAMNRNLEALNENLEGLYERLGYLNELEEIKRAIMGVAILGIGVFVVVVWLYPPN